MHTAPTPSITFRHLLDVGCRTPVLGVCTQPQPLHPATTIPSTLCATHCSSDRVLARQRPGERGFLAEFRPRPLGAGTGWQQAKPALEPQPYDLILFYFYSPSVSCYPKYLILGLLLSYKVQIGVMKSVLCIFICNVCFVEALHFQKIK